MNVKSLTILRFDDNDDVSVSIKKRGYTIFPFYKGNNNFILRCLRRLCFSLKLPFSCIWFDKRILKAKTNNIFIFESLLNEQYLAWLTKKKKNCRIVIWYWNIVKNTINPNVVRKYVSDLWSFSRKDCKTYSMMFNPAPYFSDFIYPTTQIRYDLSFVGKDKGRMSKIEHWNEVFKSKGLTTNFCITPNSKFARNKKYSKPMPYHDAMRISAASVALFDYIEIDDSGLSMRALEALFHDKKLVTNVKLIKDYDFYRKENIFILEEDCIDDLYSFLHSNYTPIDQRIKTKYEFDAFISRFFVLDKSVWWENDQ